MTSDLFTTLVRLAASISELFLLPFEIVSAVLTKTADQSDRTEERKDEKSETSVEKKPVPVLLSGMPEDIPMGISTIRAIRGQEFDMLPYTIAHDIWTTVEGIHNKDTGMFFRTIKPEDLEWKLESLKAEHPDMIVFDCSDWATALRIAEACCELDIPFATVTPGANADRIRELVDGSCTTAVVAPRPDPTIKDAILALGFLVKSVTEEKIGCFTEEDVQEAFEKLCA